MLDWRVSEDFFTVFNIHNLVIWGASSDFVSSSIPSWQILTAHAQPFRGPTDLAFCLKVPLDSLLVWASSGGSGETARMRRLAWTFAARIGDKYQIRLTRSILSCILNIEAGYDSQMIWSYQITWSIFPWNSVEVIIFIIDRYQYILLYNLLYTLQWILIHKSC